MQFWISEDGPAGEHGIISFSLVVNAEAGNEVREEGNKEEAPKAGLRTQRPEASEGGPQRTMGSMGGGAGDM